jgi:ankyrin repeat protein
MTLTKDDREYLLEVFSDIIAFDDKGNFIEIDPLTYMDAEDSCLHKAAMRGNLRAVKILVEAGLDINLPGDMSQTPLHYATGWHHPEIAEYLLSNGANPDALSEFGKKACEE